MCLPRNKLITMEFSEVLSFENILQNINDSKNNLKLSSYQRKSKKSFYNGESNSDYSQNSLTETKFSHLILLNTLKLQLRKSFFNIFKHNVQCHYPKLTPFSGDCISKKKNELIQLTKSNESVFTNDKVNTQCSSEIKEFKLEEFYKSQALENLCRLFERLLVLKTHGHKLISFHKLRTISLSIHLKRCKLNDLFTKSFSLRNIIIHKLFRKLVNKKFYFGKWKLLIKYRRKKEQEKLKKLFVRDKVSNYFKVFIYNNIFKSITDYSSTKEAIISKNRQIAKDWFLSLKLIFTMLSLYKGKIRSGLNRIKKLSDVKTNMEKEILEGKIIELRHFATELYNNKNFLSKKKLIDLHKFLLKIVGFTCIRKKITRTFKHWNKLLVKESLEEFLLSKSNIDSELNYLKFIGVFKILQNKLLSLYTFFLIKMNKKASQIKYSNENILRCEKFYTYRLIKLINLISNTYMRNMKLKSRFFVNKIINNRVFFMWETKINTIQKHLLRKFQVLLSIKCHQFVFLLSKKFQISFNLFKNKLSSLTEQKSLQINFIRMFFNLLENKYSSSCYRFLCRLKSTMSPKYYYKKNVVKKNYTYFATFIKSILYNNIQEKFSFFIQRAIDLKRNHVYNENFLNKLKSAQFLFNSLDLLLSEFKNKILIHIFNKNKEKKLKIKQLNLFVLILKNQFNLLNSSNKRFFLNLFKQNHIAKTFKENEHIRLKNNRKNKEIEYINDETNKFESLLTNCIRKAEKCGVCSLYLNENYISNSINSIREEIGNINGYRSNSLSNYLIEKDFNLPISKNIYQKTDSLYEKDYNIPVSNDILHSGTNDSLYEQDFHIPKCNDIQRQSVKSSENKEKSIENFSNMNSIDIESVSINKEYSIEEIAANEYSEYLKNSYKELINKKDIMENTYLNKIQQIKGEVQVIYNNSRTLYMRLRN